jgi:hypothetical protein
LSLDKGGRVRTVHNASGFRQISLCIQRIIILNAVYAGKIKVEIKRKKERKKEMKRTKQ